MSPVVVMATNRGRSVIRGTAQPSPHGLPIDLLDRCLIIRTAPYSVEELEAILAIRCEEEDVEVAPDARKILAKLAQEASLRYAIQLISTANVLVRSVLSPSLCLSPQPLRRPPGGRRGRRWGRRSSSPSTSSSRTRSALQVRLRPCGWTG